MGIPIFLSSGGRTKRIEWSGKSFEDLAKLYFQGQAALLQRNHVKRRDSGFAVSSQFHTRIRKPLVFPSVFSLDKDAVTDKIRRGHFYLKHQKFEVFFEVVCSSDPFLCCFA